MCLKKHPAASSTIELEQYGQTDFCIFAIFAFSTLTFQTQKNVTSNREAVVEHVGLYLKDTRTDSQTHRHRDVPQNIIRPQVGSSTGSG